LFGELHLPLVGPEDDLTLLRSVDISLAGRVDGYDDLGTTWNPRLGVRLTPISGVRLNASYGTSFRAPNLTELSDAGNRYSLRSVADPTSPTGSSQALILTGNDTDMEPETARTWSAGIEFTPVRGLSLSSTYFDTRFNNRISRITGPSTILPLERFYPGLITRNPTQDMLDEHCGTSYFFDDPALCIPSAVDVVIDARSQNMAISRVRGVDGQISYRGSAGEIAFEVGASATYLLEHSYRQTASSEKRETVDTIENPIDLRGRVFATLSRNAVSSSLALNYADGYENDRSALQTKIDSFTTVDWNLTVNLDAGLAPAKDGPVRLGLSVVNLFGAKPPFTDNSVGYDSSNADPFGRTLSLELAVRW